MIEIKNLSFSYGSATFIDNINLSLFDGSLTAIIGENGSGKSTLLKLISGELKAEGGNILVDGKDMRKLNHRESAKILSLFPQGRSVPDMTALELVSLGRYAYLSHSPFTPKDEEQIALSALEYVGASQFASISLKRMSFGERQRVYLAMQIAQDSQNLLLDEPTNFLDIRAKFSMMDTLLRLRSSGRCLVCILHDIPLAMRYADRIIVMKNGTIFAEGTPEELYENEKISKAFGVNIYKYDENGFPVYSVGKK